MFAEVGFVQHKDAFGGGVRVWLCGKARLAGIGDFDDEVGCFDLLERAFDALGLNLIGLFAYAGGIDEA